MSLWINGIICGSLVTTLYWVIMIHRFARAVKTDLCEMCDRPAMSVYSSRLSGTYYEISLCHEHLVEARDLQRSHRNGVNDE